MPYYLLVYGIVFAMGASIGSFANVVIYRLPLGLDMVKGRSFCPNCHTQIKNQHLIPLLSYWLLRGKCHHCGASIALRYPVIEAIGGGLAVLAVCVYGFTPLALCVFILGTLLLVVAVIDIDTMEIPDSLVVCLGVLSLPFALCQDPPTLVSRGIGFLVVSVPMLLLTMAIANAFGGGDIKLMAACGLILGYQNTLFAMFVAVVLGGFFAMWLLRQQKVGAKSQLCFGPFLALGVFTAQFVGTTCITWYLGLFS